MGLLYYRSLWIIGLIAILLVFEVSSEIEDSQTDDPKFLAKFHRVQKSNVNRFQKRGITFSQMSYIPTFERYYKRDLEAPPASLKRSDVNDMIGNLKHIRRTKLTPQQLLIMAMVEDNK